MRNEHTNDISLVLGRGTVAKSGLEPRREAWRQSTCRGRSGEAEARLNNALISETVESHAECERIDTTAVHRGARASMFRVLWYCAARVAEFTAYIVLYGSAPPRGNFGLFLPATDSGSVIAVVTFDTK